MHAHEAFKDRALLSNGPGATGPGPELLMRNFYCDIINKPVQMGLNVKSIASFLDNTFRTGDEVIGAVIPGPRNMFTVFPIAPVRCSV